MQRGNPNKIKDKGFDKNPQNINRKGAPKKSYTVYINELKEKGYTAPTRSEYFEMVGMLLVMSEEDLKAFATDKSKAYWLRILVLDLNDKKIRSKIQSDYRDWLFGRAEQKTDLTTNGNDLTPQKLIIEIVESKQITNSDTGQQETLHS